MMTNSPLSGPFGELNGSGEISARKSAIRKQLISQRQALLPEQLAELSLCASRHILNLPRWQTAGQVLLYSAVNGELSTSLLLENALAAGKSVLLPRCLPNQKGCMEFAPCKSEDELRPGPFGIPEPDFATCPAVKPENLNPQIAIIPGVAFSCKGLRLGYGGGYYDRFFAKNPLTGCFLVGFCASFQILNAIPHEQWDLRMDAVCTENGIISCVEQS